MELGQLETVCFQLTVFAGGNLCLILFLNKID